MKINKLSSNILAIFLMRPVAYVTSLFISWLSDSVELLIVMTIFVLLDLITGVWKVIKTQGFSHVTSIGIRRTIEKFIGYSFIIVLGLIIDKSIIELNWFSMIKIFTGLIVLAEFKSITENLTIITENKIFEKIFDFANKLFTKKINNDSSS